MVPKDHVMMHICSGLTPALINLEIKAHYYRKQTRLNKIREINAVPIDLHWFHDFFRSLIFEFFFLTIADVVTIKDETSKGNS